MLPDLFLINQNPQPKIYNQLIPRRTSSSGSLIIIFNKQFCSFIIISLTNGDRKNGKKKTYTQKTTHKQSLSTE